MNLDDIIKNLPSKDTPLFKATFEKMCNAILDKVYPIGMSVIFHDKEDHSNFCGLTWERELEGLMPIGYKENDEDFNEIGKTSGSKTHQHDFKIGFLINWSESIIQNFNNQGAWSYSQNKYSKETSTELTTFNTKVNNSHLESYKDFNNAKTTYSIGDTDKSSNLPPNKVVAFWKRVA